MCVLMLFPIDVVVGSVSFDASSDRCCDQYGYFCQQKVVRGVIEAMDASTSSLCLHQSGGIVGVLLTVISFVDQCCRCVAGDDDDQR